jgi:hypothetical protein
MLRISLTIIALIFLISAAGSDEVKPLGIPVGMFNVYGSSDGNLGRSEPDLLEVFLGTPELPYECINVVQHYWPRPESLPRVEGDRYVEWWKRYIQEAYDLTNRNGEVRLRVLVGPLYSPFIQRGEGWLSGFIRELCEFEDGSRLEGSIAGWYVAEEPMSGGHNYDPKRVNRIIQLIREAEDEAGSGHHDIYIAIAVASGRYYTPQKLVEFCKNVDVILLSSTTYLWLDPTQQPVYSPNWWAIHWSMMQVRNTLWPYFESKGEEKPKIHAILQVYDPMGYGQPTHWEIRQQINYALSYGRAFSGNSLVANDPPADGIWFFWWPGIAKNPKTVSDDWTYGRRIAEAIESSVASVKSPSLPQRTEFLLDDRTPFNPTDTPIPYQLASKGNVRIEILDEGRSPVESFEMGLQVEGVLSPFGGPLWRLRPNLKEGDYVFRLYLDEVLRDEREVPVRWKPQATILRGRLGVWSTDRRLSAKLNPPPLKNGLSGYAFLLDESPYAIPPIRINLSGGTDILESELDDGIWYLHLRCLDGAGNWSDTFHIGPIMVDSTPPEIKDLKSSIEPGIWSGDNKLELSWVLEDATSGARGLLYTLDRSPYGTPEGGNKVSGNRLSLDLGDGRWFLHVVGLDAAGNRSEVINLGPFLIDTTPPPVPRITSSSHEPGRWSDLRIISISIESEEDETSGVEGISLAMDASPEGTPDDEVELPSRGMISKEVEDGIWYLHVKSLDEAGNSSSTLHFGPIMVDSKPPPKPVISSKSHGNHKWSGRREVELSWSSGEDEGSGLRAYRYLIAREGERANWQNAVETRSNSVKLDLPDGRWVFSVLAVDEAGNLSEADSWGLWVDSTPPPPPTISSPTHREGIWTSRKNLLISWDADDLSGISSFLYLLDSKPDSEPTQRLDGDVRSLSFEDLPDGIHHFHLRAINGAGLVSRTSRYEIRVDSSVPSTPIIRADVRGDRAFFRWSVDPTPSGIAGYSLLLDAQPETVPGEVLRTTEPMWEVEGLKDGIWFLHVRAVNESGMWGETGHSRIVVDTTPPRITISFPQTGAQYREPVTEFHGRVEDGLSGIDRDSFEYSLNGGAWRSFSDDSVQESLWSDEDEIPHITRDGTISFQVRVRDRFGNVGISELVTFSVDLTPPQIFIQSPTHPNPKTWYAEPVVRFLIGARDDASGVAAYSFILDGSPKTIPPQVDLMDGGENQLEIEIPSDGIWFFHLIARDEAGNWSAPIHYRINLDATVPEGRISVLRPDVDVTTGEITFKPAEDDPPKLGFGPARVELILSEKLSDGPKLSLRQGTSERNLALSPRDPDGLSFVSEIFVDLSMEGEWEFRLAGHDRALNPVKLLDVRKLSVSSYIHGRRGGAIFSRDLKSAVVIPEGAFAGKARFEIIPDEIGYRLRILDPIALKRPMRLILPIADRRGSPVVFLHDGVRVYQIGGEVIGDRIIVEVDRPGTFLVSRLQDRRFRAWAAPNPFSTVTTFYVTGNRDEVVIRVFTVKGRLVKTLKGGRRSWDGRDEDGDEVGSGLYIFQVTDGERITGGSVVLIR